MHPDFKMSVSPLARTEASISELVGPYTFENLIVRLPPAGITLNEAIPESERGPCEPWADWKSRTLQAARDLDLRVRNSDEEDASYDSLVSEYHGVRRLLAALCMPRPVLDATHKWLFGATTDTPSVAAIQLIADALFTPDWEWNQMDSELFCLYRRAEHLAHVRQKKLDALNALLAVLEE